MIWRVSALHALLSASCRPVHLTSLNKQVKLTPGGAVYSGVKCNVASWQWPLNVASYAKSQGPLCARIDVGQYVVEGASK